MAKKATTKKTTSAEKVETNLIRKVTSTPKNTKIQEFRSGDTVEVSVKVKEGEKERIQVYKGLVTKVQGKGVGASFTVRKISSGIGVERTFPFASPAVDSVEVISHGKVRRSKLYYLRNLQGKAANIESELATARKARVNATQNG
jgi:large subunit ribosomal protein L19